MGKCEKCGTRITNVWIAVFGCVGTLFILILLIRLGMNDVLEGNPSDAMSRILVNFLQVLGIFIAFPLKWPPALLQLLKISQAVSVLGDVLVNPDCELSWVADNTFYAKLVFWAVAPITFVFLCYIFWRCNAKLHRIAFATESIDQAVTPETCVEMELTSIPSFSTLNVPVKAAVAMHTRSSASAGSRREVRTHKRVTTFIQERDIHYFKQAAASAKSIRSQIIEKLKSRKPTPKDKFILSTVILLYLCYPTVCRSVFRLFSCIPVGEDYSSGSPVTRYFLAADPEETCFKDNHLVWLVTLGLPQLLLYVLGMPLIALLVLFRNRARLENARTKYRWGILYVGLRTERYFWDVGIVAMRKIAIFCISVVVSSEKALALQTHFAMLTIIASLLAHLGGRPYHNNWRLLDILEVSGLVICWVLMWSGLWYYLKGVTTNQQEVMTVVLILINICYAIFVVLVFLRQKVKEQASWVPTARKLLSHCFSDSTLSHIGSWLPAVDPASRYWNSMELLMRARSEISRRASINSSSGLESKFWVNNPGSFCEDVDEDEENTTLPEGWFESIDPDTCEKYYFSLNGESQWEFPSAEPEDWLPD